jgi:hypothetical protein
VAEIAELLAPAAEIQHVPWIKWILNYDAPGDGFSGARFG